jgi:hypothetical protein
MPATPASPPVTPAVETPQTSTSPGQVSGEVYQPGQRVRHRYEHWWGTIVEKADISSGTETPAAARYVVAIDGGNNRGDIRPEDLTVS